MIKPRMGWECPMHGSAGRGVVKYPHARIRMAMVPGVGPQL